MTADDFFLFVSHVSEDRAAALQVVDELERRAIRCWIAPRDVGAGKPVDDESAPKVAQRLAAEIPKKGQECPDQAPDAKLRKEETRKKEDAQASPATVETSARTLPSSTGLQIVSGLLVFQALLRAGVAIY